MRVRTYIYVVSCSLACVPGSIALHAVVACSLQCMRSGGPDSSPHGAGSECCGRDLGSMRVLTFEALGAYKTTIARHG
jgi:hypothetical protein